jgi:hypothetical protein
MVQQFSSQEKVDLSTLQMRKAKMVEFMAWNLTSGVTHANSDSCSAEHRVIVPAEKLLGIHG